MCDGWGSISPELLLIIMKHLKAADLAQASHVNYHWKVVSEDDSLWKPLLIKDYDLPSKSPLRICNRWIDEYKLMKWAPPTVLGETLFECDDGLSDVCFSPNGHFFCTTTNDGRFKLWTATMPTYFVDGHSLRQNLSWDRIVSAEFSPDSYFLLFCGVKQNGNGEIAVFEISGKLISLRIIEKTG
ncbi:hypothetical protein AB6A40_006244 [Gnathostoma spinigerum]|uniref:F-box domain-containing protein n=1 Tax=Gnathostoma spinigerum TaxID=75299 RepID=A0ABD6EHT1_9BILA